MLRACRCLKPKGGRDRRSRASLRGCALLGIVLSGSLTQGLGAQVLPRAPTFLPTAPADSFVVPLVGAGFRFVATVQRHALAPSAFAAQGAYATTVRVDTVYRAPPSVGDLRGTYLTILVQDTSALPRTRPAVFLAAGVAFGDEIVLRSHGQVLLDSLPQAAPIAVVLATAEALLRVGTVKRHASTADALFLGTVLGIADSTAGAASFARHGEHDPLWRQAQVRVDATYGATKLAGRSPVQVLFPGSRDLAYEFSPRLQAGEQFVFIAWWATRLLRDSLASIALPRTYFVVRPLDVLPARDSAIVRLAFPPYERDGR